jgi:hypothetical protein
METVFAFVELHRRVELPFGAALVGLAERMTVGSEFGAAEVPVPHPARTNTADKQSKNIEIQRMLRIMFFL